MNSVGLIPLLNFAEMEANKLYRSAQPMFPYQYKWLKNKLNLTHIINLREESRLDERLAGPLGISVTNIDVKDHHPPSYEQGLMFMNLIQTPGVTALFHCEHGHGRTSTFAVIARLARGWSLEKALQEEYEVFDYHFVHQKQLDWLTGFSNFLISSSQPIQKV